MTLFSERFVEVPWAVEHARAPVLDVGCVGSDYLTDIARPVDGIDVRANAVAGLRKRFVGDIRTFAFPKKYRTVVAVSSLEHVGLAHDRYGTTDDEVESGDRSALDACVRATRKSGQVLVTVPFGTSGFYGWFRQYNCTDLAWLLDGFDATYEVWRRGAPWKRVEPEEAEHLSYDIGRASARAVALITVKVAR